MMDKAKLEPRTVLLVAYRAPVSGVATVQVSATDPVNAYVVDENGKTEYEGERMNFIPLAGSKDLIDHVLTARLSPGTRWYLIVENPSRKDIVNVSYGVVEDGYGSGGPTGYSGPSGSMPTGGIFFRQYLWPLARQHVQRKSSRRTTFVGASDSLGADSIRFNNDADCFTILAVSPSRSAARPRSSAWIVDSLSKTSRLLIRPPSSVADRARTPVRSRVRASRGSRPRCCAPRSCTAPRSPM